MVSRRARRRLLIFSLALVSAGSLLYALRWPLLGPTLVSALGKKTSSALAADLRIGTLSGSLVSSVRANDVELLPRPGSPLRSARVARLDARYGFLGLRGLHLTARGLRIELAPSDKPPLPVQQAVRDAFFTLETTPLPKSIDIQDAVVVLADGSEIRIESARLRGGDATVRLRTAAWGDITMEARRGPEHQFHAHGTAARGPVSEVLFEIEPGTAPNHPAHVTATAGGETLRWDGSFQWGADGRLSSIDGELAVREGKAATRIDLLSGRTDFEWDARIRLDKNIDADVTSRGRIRGSLSDPVDRWTVTGGFIKVDSAKIQGCSLSGELQFSEGTLAGVPWRAEVACDEDRARGEGTISWKERLGLEAQMTIDANDLRPYRGFLPAGVNADAAGIHLKGRAEIGAAGPLFEGTLRIGKGQVSGVSWQSVSWGGRVSLHELVLCRLEIVGVPAAPAVSLLGTIKASDDYRTVAFDLQGPKITLGPPVEGALTELLVKGRLDNRGIDLATVEGRLDYGPFRAIGRWDFRTPKKEGRLHLVGHNMLVLSDKLGRIRMSPDVWFSGDADRGWRLDGSAELPSILYYGELGDPQAARQGKVMEAAAPKLKLVPAPQGGFQLPGGLSDGGKIALDLELRTGKETRIENSSIGALLQAEVHLGGTLAVPAISGTVRARRGEVKLATGVFIRIERAEIALPREAARAGTIYFKGKSGKGVGEITVVIVGPLDDPVLTLTSDPPRKQEELLAILAFGKVPGSVSGQDALGTLAQKAFDQATDAWPKAEPAEDFWSRLSLSVASEDNPDPAKRAPWQLPPTASARGTILRTEYLLNPFLSVVVESDRQANVSGDLKARLHFR